jgi:hypothetical protein
VLRLDLPSLIDNALEEGLIRWKYGADTSEDTVVNWDRRTHQISPAIILELAWTLWIHSHALSSPTLALATPPTHAPSKYKHYYTFHNCKLSPSKLSLHLTCSSNPPDMVTQYTIQSFTCNYLHTTKYMYPVRPKPRIKIKIQIPAPPHKLTLLAHRPLPPPSNNLSRHLHFQPRRPRTVLQNAEFSQQPHAKLTLPNSNPTDYKYVCFWVIGYNGYRIQSWIGNCREGGTPSQARCT